MSHIRGHKWDNFYELADPKQCNCDLSASTFKILSQLAYFQGAFVRVSQSVIPSGQPTAPSHPVSHNLGHHLPPPCYCFSLSLPGRAGLVSASGARSPHSTRDCGLAVPELHCRGTLPSWYLGFQPTGACFAFWHNFLWSEMGNSPLPSIVVVPQEGSLGLTSLRSQLWVLPTAHGFPGYKHAHWYKFRTHTHCAGTTTLSLGFSVIAFIINCSVSFLLLIKLIGVTLVSKII